MDDSEQDLLKTVKYDRVMKPAPSASPAPARSLEESKKILEEAFADSKADDLEATMRFRNVIKVPIPAPVKPTTSRSGSSAPKTGSKSKSAAGQSKSATGQGHSATRRPTDPKSKRRATRNPAATQDPDQSSQHKLDPLDITERDEESDRQESDRQESGQQESGQQDSDEVARGVIPREFASAAAPQGLSLALVVTVSFLSMIIGVLIVSIAVLAFRS